jgi:hypothetical protein
MDVRCLIATVWGVPQDLGPLIGQPAFEQARGVLMQVYRCTADEAMTLIADAAGRTDGAVEGVVSRLRSSTSRATVLQVMGT